MATVDIIVAGNQDVAAAAADFLVAVRHGEATDAAIDSLVVAAEAAGRNATGIITLGLSSDDTMGVTEGVTADVVATSLAELSQSNVLLAASALLEDGDQQGDGLEEAVLDLERMTDGLVDEAVRNGGQLGFAAERPASVGPEAGSLEGFRTTVADALDAVVQHAARLASTIVGGAGNLPADQVSAAAGRIGTQLGAPGGTLKRLVAIGLEKLRSAVNSLMRLLGVERAAALRDWIADQWERVRTGELLAGPIGALLGVPATRTLADGIATSPALTEDRIEDASMRVAAVSAHYSESAGRLAGHAGVLTSTAKWGYLAAKVFPPVGPWVTGAALAGYLALLGIGLLLAMDVADAGMDLGRVVGVRGIVSELAK
jgi:hypothetical protein